MIFFLIVFFFADLYAKLIQFLKLKLFYLIYITGVELLDLNLDYFGTYFKKLIKLELNYYNDFFRYGTFVTIKKYFFLKESLLIKNLTPALTIYYGLSSAMVSEFIRFMGFLIIPFFFLVLLTNLNDFFFFSLIFLIFFISSNLNHILASIFHLTRQIYFFYYF